MVDWRLIPFRGKGKINMKKMLRYISVISILALLYGCAATHTAISKRNLDVETKMSETIFLDPVTPEMKTAFIQVRNTSGNQNLNLEQQVAQSLISKGYTIVNDPNKAHYLVQTNVLQVTKVDLKEAEDILEQGFGGGLMGAGVAAVAGADGRTILGVGMVGAAVNMVANAMVKDNFYTIVTDVQISERTPQAHVTETLDSKLVQGTSSRKIVTSTEKTDWKRYQTRIISTANKVNLELEEAIPALVSGLSNSISGLM